MRSRQQQRGFTLVEIAIVLVIIGLLIGGVLKGQELIGNSKVNSVTQSFEGIKAAYWAYKDRTGSYPASTAAAADADEQFWTDLRDEGFVSGTGAEGSEHALGGVFSYVPAETADAQFTASHICASAIENKTALNIDIKIDNADPDVDPITGDDSGAVRFAEAYSKTSEDLGLLCMEL